MSPPSPNVTADRGFGTMTVSLLSRFFDLPMAQHDIIHIFSSIARFLVPPSDQRILLSLETIPPTSIPFLLILFMAYLVRRPGTWLLRLAVAPIALIATLHVTYGYYWAEEYFNEYNWGMGKPLLHLQQSFPSPPSRFTYLSFCRFCLWGV